MVDVERATTTAAALDVAKREGLFILFSDSVVCRGCGCSELFT